MDIPRLFFERYDVLRDWLRGLTDDPAEQWRARPHGLNSIAWLVWHMARVEDSGLNRLVFDRPQVLDDLAGRWMEHMSVPLRHHGTTMTSAEVDELSVRVDIAALCAYSGAVAERTHDLLQELRPALLDEVVEPVRLRRVLLDEGMLRPQYPWQDPLPYAGRTKGHLLLHFGLTHNFGHWHDISTVRGFLGCPSL